MKRPHSEIAPPNPPWQELNPPENAAGYVSIYYSDDLSLLPVRWVTKPGDNKSDPNLETFTYGLFSTCAPSMRSGVVKRRSSYVFFATSRKHERFLTGYYQLRWYAQGVFASDKDFCLAAHSVRFISEPISLKTVDRKCGTDISKWFRNMRLLSEHQTLRLADLLRDRPDATADYLGEIDRLERFNLQHTGYRYPSWKKLEKFSWESAQDLLNPNQVKHHGKKLLNSSPSGLWKCKSCLQTVKNKALLKRCPHCAKVGTLSPKSLIARSD
jgi:hypothetical protein